MKGKLRAAKDCWSRGLASRKSSLQIGTLGCATSPQLSSLQAQRIDRTVIGMPIWSWLAWTGRPVAAKELLCMQRAIRPPLGLTKVGVMRPPRRSCKKVSGDRIPSWIASSHTKRNGKLLDRTANLRLPAQKLSNPSLKWPHEVLVSSISWAKAAALLTAKNPLIVE